MRRERFGTAKIALIGVIDEEFDAICSIGGFGVRCPNTNYYVQTVTTDNIYDVVACRVDGWGNLASGEAVADVIEAFRPYFLMLVGIAGGIVRTGERDPIKLGDVLIADYLHYSELKKLSNKKASFRYKPHDHPSHLLRLSFAEPLKRGTESSRWTARIRSEPPKPCSPKARIGNLVAGDTLMSDPQNSYQQMVLTNYYTANAVDMESMGVGREIFHQRSDPYYNPQFLVIRGISDIVDATLNTKSSYMNPFNWFRRSSTAASNQEMRDAWRIYAAEVAAAFALTVTDDLLGYIGQR